MTGKLPKVPKLNFVSCTGKRNFKSGTKEFLGILIKIVTGRNMFLVLASYYGHWLIVILFN